MRLTVTIVLAVLLMVPAHALAQDTPVAHNQTLSANPFGLLVNWLNVEYERKVSDVATVGVSASTLNGEYDGFSRGTVLLRFYPEANALTGKYIGARVGIMRARRQSERLFATGIEVGRSWLVGPNRNIGFSVGAGMDRLFGGSSEGVRALPTFRLINVGIAF